jgi:AcrR family transcriptional regulator
MSKSTPKAQETRSRILDAAVELFQERGFEETTMRDVAARAGMATGAAYYYFGSKEELVLAYYLSTHEEVRETVARSLATTKDLRERIRTVLDARFEQAWPHRKLYRALFRSGADPQNPISPFGEQTRDLREAGIAEFADAVAGSDVKIPKDLAPHLPRLLWLYQMGLVLFWIYDESEDQARTRRLLDRSLDLVVTAIKISRFRVMAPIRKAALELLTSLD